MDIPFMKLGILTVPCLYILVLLTDLVKNIFKYESIKEQALRLQTRTVKNFNKLPPDLKHITNYKVFVRKFKVFLMGGCYSIDEIYVSDI